MRDRALRAIAGAETLGPDVLDSGFGPNHAEPAPDIFWATIPVQRT
jgi:hypothetical protein